MMTTKEKISVVCEDGVELKGSLLIPENPKAVVQFNAGTGAKKEFYLPFLEYLAEHGHLCCLWDYRGSGESSPESLKGCEYTFSDYGLKDMPAVKNYLRNRFPELPFLVVAHSAGGQQWGFVEKQDDVRGFLGFAISTGYAPEQPFAFRLLSNYFFYVFSPISILFTGYVAAKRFGHMEDLPKNVVLEWRRWCAQPDYLFTEKFGLPKDNFSRYPFPIHVIWTPDDPISNQKTVSTYWSHVSGSKEIRFQEIHAKDYRVKNIGHFGFFKKNMRDTLWKTAVEKLDDFIR